MFSDVGRTTIFGHISENDIRVIAPFNGKHRDIAIDLETDPCDFNDPLFWKKSRARLITVCDLNTGVVEFVRVTETSEPVLLKGLLDHRNVWTHFHHAMFDMTFLLHQYGILPGSPICTKILAKSAQSLEGWPVGVRAGLKPLLAEFLGIETISYTESNWGAEALSDEQLKYAAQDVIHLRKLKDKLDDFLWLFGNEELYRLTYQAMKELRLVVRLRCMGANNVFGY